MGFNVTETMTEAEAATIILKQAEKFSELLAQWREAVSKGPMERAADIQSNPSIGRFCGLSSSMMSLMQLTGEAHLVVGDTEAAWADWQTMKNSLDRLEELRPGNGQMDSRMFELAWSGVRSGSWTDEQLSEISSVVSREDSLTATRRDIEQEKERTVEYFTNFDEHGKEFAKDFLKTPSPIHQMFNQTKLKLITEQQIQDNMELELHEIDQRLSRIDPETGYYIRPTEEEQADTGESRETNGPLGSFYFMLKNLNGGVMGPESTAAMVICEQSRYDHFRIAAALEMQQRATGEYPASLDAVRGRFPGGMPRDIATGQPYLYQLNANGGYTLWGTGIDGTSEGGDKQTDATYTHRPVKK